MRNIQEYLDQAIEIQEIGSDRQLSRLLGLASNSVSQFRTSRALPSPETMVKLARLAGIDEQVALIELSFMGATGEAKNAYEKILKRISVFLPATVLGSVFSSPSNAEAAENLIKPHVISILPIAIFAGFSCVLYSMYNVYYGNYNIIIVMNISTKTKCYRFSFNVCISTKNVLLNFLRRFENHAVRECTSIYA